VTTATGIMTSAAASASGLTDQPRSISSRAAAVPMPPMVVAPATTNPGSIARAVTGSNANRSGARESSALTKIEPIHHPSTITAPARMRTVTAAAGAANRSATSPAVRPPSKPSAIIPVMISVTIIQGLRPSWWRSWRQRRLTRSATMRASPSRDRAPPRA
jgi:hypothetical protein